MVYNSNSLVVSLLQVRDLFGSMIFSYAKVKLVARPAVHYFLYYFSIVKNNKSKHRHLGDSNVIFIVSSKAACNRHALDHEKL